MQKIKLFIIIAGILLLTFLFGIVLGMKSEAKKAIPGDTNADGEVTIVDLANMQKHLLGVIDLKGEADYGKSN